ncbi:MAG: hypothetical protein KA236_09830 [Verrucomicrobia bacterium]|jgi:hypothetical protein|nr:hypothetical protein [Verrucomicrobiota bacterium]
MKQGRSSKNDGHSLKRKLLFIAGVGYAVFLIAGLDTGLGVYRTPAYCLAALACAVLAAACTTKRPRVYWIIAGIAAILCTVYGYRQNQQWRERLERIKAQQPPPPTTEQTNQ